jgi:hypothetical protein
MLQDVQEMVTLYDGEDALRSECKQFTIGVHKDEWYHKDDDNICTLESGATCHTHDDCDDVKTTYDGYSFHHDEMEECEIEWSEYDGEYAYTSDLLWGYTAYRCEGWFISDDGDYIECDNNFYVNDRVANSMDIYYYHGEGEWLHIDDHPCDDEEDYEDEDEANPPYFPSVSSVVDSSDGYLALYHRGGGRGWRTDKDTTAFTMGFEVEKEDYPAKTSCNFKDLPHGWTKEQDSSLDNHSGFELISPVYDLYGTLHEEDIEGSDLLKQHINGGYSGTCGGHIHIASSKHSVEELFEKCSGFFPVLYSLYVNRLRVGFAQAKKKHEYLNRDKRSSIYVRGDTLEFRIFPAVKSVKNLMWRVGLLRIIMDNLGASERDVLRMLCDAESPLHKHVASVIGSENMIRKVNLFVEYSSLYNDVDLNGEDTEIK